MQAGLHSLGIPHEGLTKPVAIDIGEVGTRAKGGSLVALDAKQVQKSDCVASTSVAFKRGACIDTTGGQDAPAVQHAALWNAEIEAQVKEMGLLQPLMQLCAAQNS
jgi:hypothetical protein